MQKNSLADGKTLYSIDKQQNSISKQTLKPVWTYGLQLLGPGQK